MSVIGRVIGSVTGISGAVAPGGADGGGSAVSDQGARLWGASAAQQIAVQYQQQNGWMAALAGIIGTYGVIKQNQLLKRQVDLQERGVAHAERYLSLSERSFQEVTLTAYSRQEGLFDRYRETLDGFVEEYIAEGNRLKEYTPEFALQEGRAISSVQRGIDRSRRRRDRQLGRYNTGQTEFERGWFGLEAARLEADAANHAYRYEDDRKIRLDEWYWQRVTAVAQAVENYRAHIISGVNSGSTNVANGLNAVGNALTGLRGAGGQLGEAIRDRASMFGSTSNGSFRYIGDRGGYSGAGSNPSASSWNGGSSSGMFGAISDPSQPIGGRMGGIGEGLLKGVGAGGGVNFGSIMSSGGATGAGTIPMVVGGAQ